MHQDLSTFLPQKLLNLGYTKFFYELKPKSKGKISSLSKKFELCDKLLFQSSDDPAGLPYSGSGITFIVRGMEETVIRSFFPDSGNRENIIYHGKEVPVV
jgi:hypothetical protein